MPQQLIDREAVLRRIRAVLAKDEDTFIRNYLIDNIAALPDASPVSEEREEIIRGLEFIANRPVGIVYSAVLDEDVLARAIRLLRAPQQQAEPCPLCRGSGKVEVTSFSNPKKSISKSCHICKGTGVLAAPPPDDEAVRLLRELAPYLEILVCYASTVDEYEPNRIVANVMAYLARKEPKG